MMNGQPARTKSMIREEVACFGFGGTARVVVLRGGHAREDAHRHTRPTALTYPHLIARRFSCAEYDLSLPP